MIKLKTLLNEGVTENTAIEYLKKLVQEGPYKGNVYLAGGAVRDIEMGGSPKDLDVVVTNNGLSGGMDFAKWATQHMGNYSETGNPVLFPTFGTAKFILKGIKYNGVDLSSIDVECVAARKEEYTHGSRKPVVTAGTIKDDVYRRDYTINSLLLDLTTGKVLDLTGRGIVDIHNGILKTTSPADEIYQQDSLRILRGVRFAIKYGFTIDEETMEGMKRNINELQHISKERIRDEMNKMLLTDHPAEALEMLKDIGALKYISPELEKMIGLGQNQYHSKDVWGHTLDVIRNTKPILFQRVMALFHDVGKVTTHSVTPTGVHFYGHEKAGVPITKLVMADLKYPSDIINAVAKGVENHMRLKRGGDDSIQLTDKALRKFKIEMGEHLEDILSVIHADNISHATTATMPNQIENIRKRLIALDVKVSKPILPINGNDLINIGIPKGPIYSEILSAITDAWYENPNLTKEEAIRIVRNIIKK